MNDVRDRGVGATTERLQRHCLWPSMEDGLKKVVWDSLFLTENCKVGLFPRPLSDNRQHSGQPDSSFDLLYLRNTFVRVKRPREWICVKGTSVYELHSHH